jgi:RNA polymerase sigma-70 factor (ECF subfamily)
MTQTEIDQPSQEWQAVWQQHSKWLRTVLLARLRDGLIVDELLQDVAVIAWRKREQLTDDSKIAPWLYRIAIRQIQMFWRKRSTVAGRSQSLTDSQNNATDERQADPLDWITSREAHQQVRDAMGELSSQDREILMLKHTEDWTYQQISQHLGISMDKIVYRLNRARTRLRNKLSVLESDWGQK